ncbi:MAG: tyrosine-type recombinase/integrase, partial [Afipia sp.]|nr:tyrosine-type recombinase/integrase [Afipia sp.]
ALPWSGYDGKYIRLTQSKTNVKVIVPVAAQLKALLDATVRVGPFVLLNSDNDPWTSGSFQQAWSRASVAAEIVGKTFHDLRGTAVTRLAIAGCTEAEIATITGHT